MNCVRLWTILQRKEQKAKMDDFESRTLGTQSDGPVGKNFVFLFKKTYGWWYIKCVIEKNNYFEDLIWFIVFNATFSNISAISWRPVLVVEEAGVPGEDHGQAAGKLYHLRLRVECTLFCNLQSQVRTHAVLVIGLYVLLGNPTT